MPIDWRRRERAARFDHGGPIRYISLAPVAGVMLVAAAMISLSFPITTHALTFDVYPGEGFGLDAEFDYVNRIDIDRDGTLHWNRTAVTDAEMVKLLNATLTGPQEPALVFRPDDNAAYGDTAQMLAIIKSAGITQFCIIGLERNRRYEDFEQLPDGRNIDEIDQCDFWRGAPQAGRLF